MRRLAGIMLIGAVCAALCAGCALRNPRADYAYFSASDGLWGDASYEIIDWNFPTSLNQPPVEAPKRLRLDRTAIGVTWATKNPLPLADNLAPWDAPPTAAAKGDDATATAGASRPSTASTASADRERRGAR